MSEQNEEQPQRKVVTKIQIVVFDDGNFGMHVEGRGAPADMMAAEAYLRKKVQIALDRMELAQAMSKRSPIVQAPAGAVSDLKKVG